MSWTCFDWDIALFPKQVILSCSALPCLLHLLSSSKESIRKESCWTISNITAGNRMQIQVGHTAIVRVLIHWLIRQSRDITTPIFCEVSSTLLIFSFISCSIRFFWTEIWINKFFSLYLSSLMLCYLVLNAMFSV